VGKAEQAAAAGQFWLFAGRFGVGPQIDLRAALALDVQANARAPARQRGRRRRRVSSTYGAAA
jgi:hypothetical protein